MSAMTNPFDFTDQVVVITGAATGIGRATALEFATHGARVVIGDVDPRAEETVGLIRQAGCEAIFVRTNVSDDADVQGLVKAAVDNYGRLDVAFNNAGILPPTGALLEQTLDDWNRTLAVDLTGVFLSMKHELTHMLTVGRGTIINTASVAGVIADPGMAPYAAAKHGVVGLTKAAALDYATAGVRINALAPGLVETPMTSTWLADPEMRETVLANTPMKRPATPAEIAGTVLFLASPAASYTNGAVIIVDGGQTAH
jgi:NAD(P)-dependent dehydrogenase (short-subunit alcohol dehydrogenase family)